MNQKGLCKCTLIHRHAFKRCISEVLQLNRYFWYPSCCVRTRTKSMSWLASVCGLALCSSIVLISDLVQCRLFIHFKQPLSTLEILPFPEKKKKSPKNKRTKASKNVQSKFYNIWCSTSYDQLHFILTSQAHSISHFFKQHFHKTIS